VSNKNIYLIILLFFICFFIFFNNLFFLYKKEVIFNNFFVNFTGINNLDLYKENINFNYESIISTANNILFYYILGKNIYFIFFFNFLTYIYIIYKFLKYFTDEKKKLLFLLFTILNLEIISHLNFPSKDINSFFSMIFLFMYYIEKKNLLLICSIFFAFFSRNVQLLIIISILLLNLNIFSYLNNFFKKSATLSYSALYLILATIYHLLEKITVSKNGTGTGTGTGIGTGTGTGTGTGIGTGIGIDIGSDILILPSLHSLKNFFIGFNSLIFNNLNLFSLKIFFFYIIHVYLFKFVIKLFLKNEVNKVNVQICLISFVIVFISETIKSEHSFYATFDALRYGNINLTSKFHVTLILDEYCKKGFFFLIYPAKILALLFNEIFKFNEFKLSTLSQFLTFFIFFFTIYSVIKKKLFIKFKFFLIFFIPLIVYSIPGHFSIRVALYIYTVLSVYFLIYKKTI
jgi:hypothetical protein